MRNREEEDGIGTEIVDAAYHVHKELGPGLLERVYEACMEYELVKRGFNVKRQITLPIEYNGMVFNEALKLDLLINDSVIIELKSIELHNKLWEAQILSHLKLTQLNLGYLINFGTPLIKQGIKRYKINI
ncbi:MAG: GxxExxY protein [Sphingobacteriaceae bacterium]|nr:GxxExxY protein [Sphingobacteriaceae bacterium]MBK7816756.1 GxxExxY protein [Sphingobacteriaceae bacterium]